LRVRRGLCGEPSLWPTWLEPWRVSRHTSQPFMRTRYGLSPWVHEFPDTRRPSFDPARGTLKPDVVIVGAGLTGCVTAYLCASAGLKTIVLEADRIGLGATGRSGGLLLPEPGPSFKDLTSAQGLRIARGVFESWRKASMDA